MRPMPRIRRHAIDDEWLLHRISARRFPRASTWPKRAVMSEPVHRPLSADPAASAPPAGQRGRLRVDVAAVAANFALMQATAGAPAGAAVKAQGYGIGLAGLLEALWQAGARDLFVATLAEGLAVRAALPGARVHVLNGLDRAEIGAALAARLQPVLSTPRQLAAWAPTGAACDVMLDTGINRLGFGPAEQAQVSWAGLDIDVVMSHLACGDEPEHGANRAQHAAFIARAPGVPGRRRSLAASAGIALGRDYAFDLVRPGLALYGGQPWADAFPALRPVVAVDVPILQVRDLPAGSPVGYGQLWHSPGPTRIATLGAGYADGYLRSFTNRGEVLVAGQRCPVVGRVSMDLTTVDVSGVPGVHPGDRATLLGDGISLWEAAGWSGLSQYELLTLLGDRYERLVCGSRA